MQTRATIRGNVLVALLLLVSFPNFAFAREIGSYEDFSASVADPFQCADVIDVTVDSSSADAFRTNPAGLAKLVGLVRIALGFECPQATALNFVGVAGGDVVMNATSRKANSWQLEQISYPGQETPKAEAVSDGSSEAIASQEEGGAEASSYVLADDQIGWLVYRRKPFENEVEIDSVVVDSSAFQGSPYGTVRIHAKRDPSAVAGVDFDYRFTILTDRPHSRDGSITVLFDGQEVHEFTYRPTGKPIRPDNAAFERLFNELVSASKLTLKFRFQEANFDVSMMVSGVTDAGRLVEVNQQALYEHTHMLRGCVSKSNGNSYGCLCRSYEFVLGAPRKVGLEQTEREEAIANANGVCERREAANPLLVTTPLTQLLIGAKLRSAEELEVPGYGLVSDAAVIESLLVPGPGFAAGLRSGDIIVDSSKSNGAQSVLSNQMLTLGKRAVLTVFRDGETDTREVVVPIGMPSEAVKAVHIAPTASGSENASTSGGPIEAKNVQAVTGQTATVNPANVITAEDNKGNQDALQSDQETVEMGHADPLYDHCKSERMSQYYDCQCLAEKGEGARTRIVQSDERKGLIQHREKSLENMQKLLVNETDPNKRANLERSIAKTQDMIAELKDPSAIPPNNLVFSILNEAKVCKRKDFIYKENFDSCLRTQPEETCKCIAEHVSDLWVQSNDQYSSKFIVNASTQARLKCK